MFKNSSRTPPICRTKFHRGSVASFKKEFLEKFIPEYHQGAKSTFWIQIRPDISSDLIWIQTDGLKEHQQITLADEEFTTVSAINLQTDA